MGSGDGTSMGNREKEVYGLLGKESVALRSIGMDGGGI